MGQWTIRLNWTFPTMLREQTGVAAGSSDKRIDVQYDALPFGGQPPPTADVHLHPAVPRWKVCNDGLFREPVGAEILLLLRTVVPFVKMYLQHSLVNDGLLLLTRTQRHLVCPHHLEEVQHTFRKEEASEVLIYVDCFLVFYDYKGTSFLRIYLYSQTFTSYQTRKFASVPTFFYIW